MRGDIWDLTIIYVVTKNVVCNQIKCIAAVKI
ncbi:MAG: hypothetical protein RL308_2470 [Bacteroidota bacterium]|jgi:hypothetical protein